MSGETADPLVLVPHLTTMHKRAPKSGTLAQLVRWHQQEHYRSYTTHWHEGVNLGPDHRPAGWVTGEGAVLR